MPMTRYATATRIIARTHEWPSGGLLTLQVFPEASDETGLEKADRPVGGGADLVVWLRVRRELTAALRAAPVLRRRDQRSADAVATSLWGDEPPLEVRDPITVA